MLYYNLSKAFSQRALTALLACVLGINAHSQESDPSPWSRFGFGVNMQSYSSPQQLMGGVISPMMEKGVINPSQPASAAGCTSTILQSSIYNSTNSMVEADSNTTAITGNIGALSMVIKQNNNKTAMMFGLVPNSSRGYSLYREYEDQVTGNITEYYRGNGGTARSYVGLARALKGKKWHHTSDDDSVFINNRSLQVGAQFDYLFGEVVSNEVLDIENVTYADAFISTSMRHRGIRGVFGVQAYQLLKIKYDQDKNFIRSTKLYLGGTYSTRSKLNTDYERLRAIGSFESNQFFDTAYYYSDPLIGQIPVKWSTGAAISLESASGSRLLVGFDYAGDDWSIYNTDSTNNYLLGDTVNVQWEKASKLSTGISFKPHSRGSSKSVLSRTTYKAGYSIDKYPLSYNSNGEFNQLAEWRLSCGLSMPMERSRSNSRVHLGLEYGKRSIMDADGTFLDNTIEENILNIQIGVTLAPFFKNLWLTPKLYD